MMIVLIVFEVIMTLLVSIYHYSGGVIALSHLEYLLFLVYATMLGYTYTNCKKVPLAFIISLLFGLFIYSRFLLDAVGLMPYNVSIATRFTPYVFSAATMQETLVVYTLSCTALLFGIAMAINGPSFTQPPTASTQRLATFFKRTGLIIILISLPGLAYKLYTTTQYILSYGYLAFYTGIERGAFERLLEFSSYKLYLLGASLYLSGNLKKKEFFWIASLMFLISATYLALGKRAEFGISLLFIFWYWYSFVRTKRKSIKIRYKIGILLLIIPIVMVLQQTQLTRNNAGNQNGNPIINFVASQGVSGIILPYYIDQEKYLTKQTLPSILSPIVDRFKRGSQDVDMVKNSNYFAHKLTYSLDPNAFLNGEGLGAQFITELYEVGEFAVLIGLAGLGFIIVFYDRYKHIHLLKYLSLISMMTLFFLPRGELFEYFYEYLYLLIAYLLILAMYLISTKRRPQ